MTVDDVRRIALSLEGTTEEPHFHMTSFRVRKRIFATALPEGDFVHLFLEEPLARALAEEQPACFSELYWGKAMLGVRAELSQSNLEEIAELLRLAWSRRAGSPSRGRS